MDATRLDALLGRIDADLARPPLAPLLSAPAPHLDALEPIRLNDELIADLQSPTRLCPDLIDHDPRTLCPGPVPVLVQRRRWWRWLTW